MTDNEKQVDEQRIWCCRLERKRDVAEHADCPYCFGRKQQIEGGEHAEFCDFKPGVDPISFGFPPDSSRYTNE